MDAFKIAAQIVEPIVTGEVPIGEMEVTRAVQPGEPGYAGPEDIFFEAAVIYDGENYDEIVQKYKEAGFTVGPQKPFEAYGGDVDYGGRSPIEERIKDTIVNWEYYLTLND
jgi:hypothetical protein